MHQEQQPNREELEQQIRDANNVRAVINSKGWKETCAPMIMKHRDQIITTVEGQIWNPDPTIAAKAMWVITGIDAVLKLFANIEESGRLAKQILTSDTAADPDEG